MPASAFSLSSLPPRQRVRSLHVGGAGFRVSGSRVRFQVRVSGPDLGGVGGRGGAGEVVRKGLRQRARLWYTHTHTSVPDSA
eukprot:3779302-Rhodomonas_salina.1